VNGTGCSDWCYHYEPGDLEQGHLWDGHTTSTGNQLSHARTGGLAYGFWGLCANGVLHQITAADVDRFWECAIYSGYDKISGASLGMNCHGFSTGVGYWLNDFQKLVDDDYTKYDRVGDLEAGAVYGGDGHSIKIVEVYFTGEPYKIVTHEKNRDSGVYGREICPVSANNADEVALDMNVLEWKISTDDPTSESVDPPFDHFYKRN